MHFASRFIFLLILLTTTPVSAQQADIANKTVIARQTTLTIYVYIATSGDIFRAVRFDGSRPPGAEQMGGAEYKLGRTSEFTVKQPILTCTFRVSANLTGHVLTLKDISEVCQKKNLPKQTLVYADRREMEINFLSGTECKATGTSFGSSDNYMSCQVVDGNQLLR